MPGVPVFPKTGFILLFILIGSILLYVNTLPGGFVFDDLVVTERQELRTWPALLDIWTQPYVPGSRASGVWRPLTMMTFVLQFLLTGDSPLGFHLTSILLNCVVVGLVYAVLAALYKDRRLVLLMTGIYAVFPIHTEAVASIKARDELLAAVFGLLSWWLYSRAVAEKRAAIYLWGSSLCFLAAVLSKETFIVLPAVFLTVAWAHRAVQRGRLFRTGVWYAAVAAGYLLLRLRVLGEYALGVRATQYVWNPLAYEPWTTRLWTAAGLLYYYVRKTIFPFDLTADYSFRTLPLVTAPWQAWQSVFGIALGLLALLIVLHPRTRRTPPATGALIFLLAYFPVSQLAVFPVNLFAERWMYFPSLGIAVLLGWGLWRLGRRFPQPAAGITGLLLVYYVLSTVMRNPVWYTSESLYRSMVRGAPQNVHARFLLGVWYLERGMVTEANEQADAGMNIYADHPSLVNLKGSILVEQGQYAAAEQLFYRTIALAPSEPIGYSNIAQLWLRMGETRKACTGFQLLLTHPDPAVATIAEQGLRTALSRLGRNSCEP